jgi:hypothetical protein
VTAAQQWGTTPVPERVRGLLTERSVWAPPGPRGARAVTLGQVGAAVAVTDPRYEHGSNSKAPVSEETLLLFVHFVGQTEEPARVAGTGRGLAHR